jgi:biopolymer transport protein ExbB
MIIQEILNIWNSGGWVMVPLSLLALFIYTTSFDLILYLNNNKIELDNNDKWKSWIENPKLAPKNAKEIIRYSQEDVSSSKHLRNRFEEIHQNLIHNVERKLIFLNTLVASAPLMGLLGTVIGMLGTFSAISSGSGSETVDMVAAGISEALITTQTGLFIALPGIFLILIIRRKKSAIESSIMRLESQSLTSLNLT